MMRMRPAVRSLAETGFDVVVVGAGIYGVCTAWRAAQRGLRTALLDRGDFGAATSANSLRTIHGGLRYLQHLDLRRMRESIRARREWLTTFPEAMAPMAFALPTAGYGLQGSAALACALVANDCIGFDRNRGVPRQCHIPRGRVISRVEASRLYAGTSIPTAGGAAIWYDGVCPGTERLLIDIVRHAVDCGAVAVNHFEVSRIARESDGVSGVEGVDGPTGCRVDVRAHTVVNATGPWLDGLLGASGIRTEAPLFRPSRAFNLVTRRLPFDIALGLPVRRHGRDSDAFVHKGTNTYFVLPWGRHSLIGTRHLHGGSDGPLVSSDEVRKFIDEINPLLGEHALQDGDVRGVFAGLLPAKAAAGSGEVVLEKHGRIVDHASSDGVKGLWSLLGVKWTMALSMATELIDRIARAQGHAGPVAIRPLETDAPGRTCADPTGTHANDELASDVLRAVSEEFAISLDDALMRRASLILDPDFDDAKLQRCAAVMATRLDWSDDELERNLARARQSWQRIRYGSISEVELQ